MSTPRSGLTATLLPDGKVLIAGGGFTNPTLGAFADPALANAEIYDPDSGTFPRYGRYDHAVFRSHRHPAKQWQGSGFQRGMGDRCFPLRAELYDPTGTFAATVEMTSEWADTATLLRNGQVLIYRDAPEITPLFFTDLYDPSTGVFTGAARSMANHSRPTATLLFDGRVLLAGGDVGDGDGASSVAELYDPATGNFALTGTMTPAGNSTPVLRRKFVQPPVGSRVTSRNV